jgi:hypothetical protein
MGWMWLITAISLTKMMISSQSFVPIIRGFLIKRVTERRNRKRQREWWGWGLDAANQKRHL